MPEDITFTLSIESDADLDAEDLLDEALKLRRELLAGPVESVTSVESAALPAGTKGAFGLTPELAVTLAVGVLEPVMLLAISWLERRKTQSIKVKIKEVEVEIPRGANQAEVEQIVKLVEKYARRNK